jgi:hypothetical protein
MLTTRRKYHTHCNIWVQNKWLHSTWVEYIPQVNVRVLFRAVIGNYISKEWWKKDWGEGKKSTVWSFWQRFKPIMWSSLELCLLFRVVWVRQESHIFVFFQHSADDFHICSYRSAPFVPRSRTFRLEESRGAGE